MFLRITTTCLILFVLFNKVVAQDLLIDALNKDSRRDTKTYTIKSLGGQSRKVHITPDYANRSLRISCLSDTISVNDYWDVPPEVYILNKNFLTIKYEVRGGSGLGLGNIIVLCIKNNRLYEAIHVLRYSHSEGDGEIEDYRIKPVLIGNSGKTYRLNVKVNDASYSKYNTSSNFNYQNLSVLKFDINQNVFFSVKKNIYGEFTIYDLKTDKEIKQQVRGNFPAIILGTENYYFINDEWYQLGDDKHLYKFTSATRNK
jgi:hypothetical protein